MTFDRAEAIRRLADESFDVLVVGGGITGTGVALDAASRGLRTALVDKGDFASGTSSKSSKLVHGGIRYLQQKEVGLVYEALAERQILRKTAPHLVRVLPFLLPVFTKDGLLPRRIARLLGATMWAYDLTGGLRIGKLHKRVSKDEALRYMPTLPVDNIAASYIYYDAQADDARLTLTVAKTAADHGAAVVNYATLIGLTKDDAGKVTGARARVDGAEIEIRARAVVNATGVWSDDIRALDDRDHATTIRPAKGIHITVPWSLVRNEIAVVIPVPKDRRSVFVVPWGGDGGPHKFTYIGTTDTDYDGPIDDPQITPADVEYLLRADQRRVDDEDHRERHPRHVGRPASPRRGGQERAHRRPLPPSFGAHVAGRSRQRHGRKAHDLPAHGRRRGRPSGEARRARGQEPHEADQAARCSRVGLGRRTAESGASVTAPTGGRSPRSKAPTPNSPDR